MKTRLTPVQTALLAAITSCLLISAAPANAGPGYALSVSGDQYVTATIPALTNNYTFSAWVNLNFGGTMSGPRVGVLSATNCCGSVEVTIQAESSFNTDPQNLMLGRCGCFNGVNSDGVVLLNQWAYLAVTVDSNNRVSYFINGIADISWDGSAYDLTIGPNITLADNTIRTFNGTLDEVQIWSTVLSQPEILAGMNQSPDIADTNLVAYWSFNDDTGTTATNGAKVTGSACDATLVNSPTWVLSGVPFIPDVTTGGATNVSYFSATLTGTVNPCNLPTTAWFQWGTDTNYGNLTSATNLPATNASLGASLSISNLPSSLTYHFRLVASNSAGVTLGGDQSSLLLFPPIVTSSPATSISSSAATLNGTVNPDDLPAMAWFEWGTTTDYGNFTVVSFPGSGSQALPLSYPLTGLAAYTSYHYRIDAYNDLGLAQGEDQRFTTPDAPRTITGCSLTAARQFQFRFTGAVGSTYTVLCSTNLALPLANWAPVGAVTNIAPGQYQFTDPASSTNQPQRFYRLRWP